MQIQQMSVVGHITIHKKKIRGHIIGSAYNFYESFKCSVTMRGILDSN